MKIFQGIGNSFEGFVEKERECFFAELVEKCLCFFDEGELSFTNDPNAIGKKFRLFQIVRSQNNRHSLGLERANVIPHPFAQLNIYSRGGFVEKKNFWFIGKGFSDKYAPFHTAGQFLDEGVFLVPQAQVLEYFFEKGVIFWPSIKSALIDQCIPRRIKRIEGNFLGNISNKATYLAPLGFDVVPQNGNRPARFSHCSAYNADKCRFSSTVWSQKRKKLPLRDGEVYI